MAKWVVDKGKVLKQITFQRWGFSLSEVHLTLNAEQLL